jgi:hypothetical protein
MVEDSEFLMKVLLLALYNKGENSSIQDVLVELDAVNAIKMNDSKQLLKEIKSKKLFVDGKFTELGTAQVAEAQKFFEL